MEWSKRWMLGCVTSSPLPQQARVRNGIRSRNLGNRFSILPVDMAVRVPESGDDDPGVGVNEDNFVLGEVEADQVDLGAVSDGVNLFAGADHPVIVSELLMLPFLELLLMLLLLGVGRPWRAGDDASVVNDEHRHSMDNPIVIQI